MSAFFRECVITTLLFPDEFTVKSRGRVLEMECQFGIETKTRGWFREYAVEPEEFYIIMIENGRVADEYQRHTRQIRLR